LQQSAQPGQQILVTLGLGGIGVKVGAQHGVRGVVDAEDQMALRLLAQRGLVGQRGQVLTDLLRIGMVALELQPLGFSGQAAQAVNEGDEVSRVHGLRRRQRRAWSGATSRPSRPVMWRTIRVSRAFSLVSVVMTATSCAGLSLLGALLSHASPHRRAKA
jgi:hypothetical protein